MESPETNPVFNKNHRSTAIPVAKFPAGKPPAAHIPPVHHPPLPARKPLASHIPPVHQPAAKHPVNTPSVHHPPLPAGKPAATHIPPAHQPAVKHPPAKPKSHYIPGLDGLRALAVISVITYHLHPSGFPGGFLGVDIFFVLSGFLITTLLLRELSKTGKVSLGHFWLRRARRLLPALLVLIITVVPAAFLVNRDLLVGIGRQVLGALTFSTNWLEIAHGSSYFAATTPILFKNFWSLAIEEQFYLFWPLIFLACVTLFKRRWMRMLIPVAMAGTSAFLMGYLFDPDNTTRVYYGTDTHLFGLALGICVAFLWSSRDLVQNPDSAAKSSGKFRKFLVQLLGFICLAALIAAMLLLTDASPYTFREGIAGCSLVVALLIWCILKPGSLLARLGELRLLKYIGTRSYGLYLWHWPILIIAGALYPTAVESALYWVRSVLCVLITVLICELSYRFLETPVRKRGFRKAFSRPQAPIWQRLIQVVAVLLALALTGVTGLAIAKAPSKSQTQLAIEQAQKQDKEETKKTPTPKPTTPEPEPTPEDDRLVLSKNLDTSNPSGEEITAIGDSIISAASGGFDKAMPGINFLAKPNRQWGIASEIISEGLAAGEIRRTVVISYGTNAGVYDAELVHQAIKQLGPDRMILLVNLYSPSTFVPESNQILADIANQYANVKLIDWNQAVSQHPEWLHVDQTHPNMTGAVKMGELVRANIDEMSAELTALKAKQKKQRERASAPHSRKKR
ncbi:acyltransferase family protein [Varibaculum prostatecancerukia]|uniref:acyltransferase family protein n=1 Tax=Varibaculum prostatecancerukia TaxID=2811781 RepID=UPI001C006B35|nr:acyltransferase family protein [Varibaculum prostatecancerukia]